MKVVFTSCCQCGETRAFMPERCTCDHYSCDSCEVREEKRRVPLGQGGWSPRSSQARNPQPAHEIRSTQHVFSPRKTSERQINHSTTLNNEKAQFQAPKRTKKHNVLPSVGDGPDPGESTDQNAVRTNASGDNVNGRQSVRRSRRRAPEKTLGSPTETQPPKPISSSKEGEAITKGLEGHSNVKDVSKPDQISEPFLVNRAKIRARSFITSPVHVDIARPSHRSSSKPKSIIELGTGQARPKIPEGRGEKLGLDEVKRQLAGIASLPAEETRPKGSIITNSPTGDVRVPENVDATDRIKDDPELTDTFHRLSVEGSEGYTYDSDENEASPGILSFEEQLHDFIDFLMRDFCAWWYKRRRHEEPEYIRQAPSNNPNNSSKQDGNNKETCQSVRKDGESATGQHNNGAKRSADEASGDKGEEGPSSPLKRRRPSKAGNEVEKFFACPFYKRDLRKYQNCDGCATKGWDSTARLKTEHLYKHHIYLCSRCGKHFQTDQLLTNHVRSPQACQVQPWRLVDKITAHQEKQLRDQKKEKQKGPALSEEKKWYEIFKILFPDDDPEKTPASPYYDRYEYEHANDIALSQLDDDMHSRGPQLIRQVLSDLGSRVEEARLEIIKSKLMSFMEFFRASISNIRQVTYQPMLDFPDLPDLTSPVVREVNSFEPENALFGASPPAAPSVPVGSVTDSQPSELSHTADTAQALNEHIPPFNGSDEAPLLHLTSWTQLQGSGSYWLNAMDLNRIVSTFNTAHSFVENDQIGSFVGPHHDATGGWSDPDTRATNLGLVWENQQMRSRLGLDTAISYEISEPMMQGIDPSGQNRPLPFAFGFEPDFELGMGVAADADAMENSLTQMSRDEADQSEDISYSWPSRGLEMGQNIGNDIMNILFDEIQSGNGPNRFRKSFSSKEDFEQTEEV